MASTEQADVVIVGGGISGLYNAWRLASCTDLTVSLLEYTHRFGGRFQTCEMPGGFPADLGAMRFLPLSHPILFKLIRELDVKIEKFYQWQEGWVNEPKHYHRRQHVRNMEELRRVYSVEDKDLPYFGFFGGWKDVIFPDDGHSVDSTIGATGMLARDTSLSLYTTLSQNSEVFSCGVPFLPGTISALEVAMWSKQHPLPDDPRPLARPHCPVSGMEQIIKSIVESLREFPNVKLHTKSPVYRIEETDGGFRVICHAGDGRRVIETKKVILACNARGMELITWISPENRTTALQQQLSRVNRTPCFKIFLTYSTPWWQSSGLYYGDAHTDLPLGQVIAFGTRGTRGGYSTLLAAFTFRHKELFEGLNHRGAARFENKVGDVDADLIPSRRLVDYVHKQLSEMFGEFA